MFLSEQAVGWFPVDLELGVEEDCIKVSTVVSPSTRNLGEDIPSPAQANISQFSKFACTM